jgi:nucleoside 2-deoxyribosyltransferase
MRIYLAGPINGCSDNECCGWREKAKILLDPHVCVDPMIRDYRNIEDLAYISLVEDDKNDIDSCDVVLAMCSKPSVGTSMEILYAWENNKIVVVIGFGKLSPWIRYHSRVVVSSLSEAVKFILDMSYVD